MQKFDWWNHQLQESKSETSAKHWMTVINQWPSNERNARKVYQMPMDSQVTLWFSLLLSVHTESVGSIFPMLYKHWGSQVCWTCVNHMTVSHNDLRKWEGIDAICYQLTECSNSRLQLLVILFFKFSNLWMERLNKQEVKHERNTQAIYMEWRAFRFALYLQVAATHNCWWKVGYKYG